MGWHGLGDTSLLSQATWDWALSVPLDLHNNYCSLPTGSAQCLYDTSITLHTNNYWHVLTTHKTNSSLPSHCWFCPASKQWNVVKLLFCRVSFPDHSLPQTTINAYNNWAITSQVVTLLCKIVYQNTNKDVGTLSLLAVDHHLHTSTCKLYTEVSQVHPAPPDHWVTRPDHWVSLVV